MENGKVIQVIGPVVDVQFFGEKLPSLHHALLIREPKQKLDITLEVEEHLGDGVAGGLGDGVHDAGLVMNFDEACAGFRGRGAALCGLNDRVGEQFVSDGLCLIVGQGRLDEEHLGGDD